MDEITKEFLQKLQGDKIKINEYSPIALAYIGDVVYELYIKTRIILKGNAQVNKMNTETINYVKASEQAKIFHKIENILTEEEINIFKRGRNAKPGTIPKNAIVADYKCATGFETLIGYLYLDNQLDRLIEILDKCII